MDAHAELGSELSSVEVCAVTEVELVMSSRCPGGSDGQPGLCQAAVYEVAAVLDVPQAEPDALDEVSAATAAPNGR
ncbi:hypothetical protein [Streptomyces sp. 7N604]|uniref:hypothetical protein n=1 Tax=Streptomyces sp. 7N604 TaxID=3457415 RepID=UPI003FD20431